MWNHSIHLISMDIHWIWYRSTYTTLRQIQWSTFLFWTKDRYIFRWNQEILWEEWDHGQDEWLKYKEIDIWPRTQKKYLIHYSLLQLGTQQECWVSYIHHFIRFKQYHSYLSIWICWMRNVYNRMKSLYKLLTNLTYNKYMETGLKPMKVKLISTLSEYETIIINKEWYDLKNKNIFR